MTTSPTDRAAILAIARKTLDQGLYPWPGWITRAADNELVAFWQAATAAERERRSDELSAALHFDLEHGVKWLSEKAAADFASAYPALAAAIRSGVDAPPPETQR